MDKSTDLTDDQILAALDTRPWYGLCRLKTVRLPRGGVLLDLAENRAEPFARGLWLIGVWIPSQGAALPDWGSLVMRGPDRFVMRSRDGRTVIAPGRNGLVYSLHGRSTS